MKFIKSRAFRLFIIVVSLVIAIHISRDIYGLWRRKDIVGGRQSTLSRLEEENQKLSQKLKDAQSPSYVERIAREKLGLIKEGEAIVLVPKTQSPAGEGDQPTTEELPNWKKWWKLFF